MISISCHGCRRQVAAPVPLQEAHTHTCCLFWFIRQRATNPQHRNALSANCAVDVAVAVCVSRQLAVTIVNEISVINFRLWVVCPQPKRATNLTRLYMRASMCVCLVACNTEATARLPRHTDLVSRLFMRISCSCGHIKYTRNPQLIYRIVAAGILSIKSLI